MHELDRGRISGPRLLISESIERLSSSLVLDREWQSFGPIVSGAAQRIKDRHLPADLLQHEQRAIPPDSPVIESIKRAERADVASELGAQLCCDRSRLVHEIIRRESGADVIARFFRRRRFGNLAVQRGINMFEPFAGIRQLRTAL